MKLPNINPLKDGYPQTVSILEKMNIQPDTMAVRMSYAGCGELHRKNALMCEGCEQLWIKQRWDEAEKTDWADGDTVYSAKAKKFYSDKEIYKKDCLEMKCSTEDMLLFACNPIYPSDVSKSAILGQELREAILPSSIIEKLNELNTAIDAC